MTPNELVKSIERIVKLIENTPEAPAPGHPDLERWATDADNTLDEVLALLQEILA